MAWRPACVENLKWNHWVYQMEALALGDSLLEYTPFQGCADGFDFKFVYVLGTVWADRPPPAAKQPSTSTIFGEYFVGNDDWWVLYQ